MRFRVLAAVCLAAIGAVTLSCGKEGSQKEILVGEYGSLTGGIATFGISTHNGFELAFDEINAKGGVLGKKIELLVEDDQSKPEEAGTVVNKLINQDHVVAMLGEVASSHSLAAAPICQANKVPMISPVLDQPQGHPGRRLHLPRLLHRPVPGRGHGEVRRRHAQGQEGRDPRGRAQRLLGRPARRSSARPSRSSAARSSAEQSYSQGDSDFRAQLTAIKAAKPEAIYVPGYYTEVGHDRAPGARARHHGAALGGDGWDSPKLFEIGGEALDGCYFSNHYSTDDPNPVVQKFVADYKAKYGELPDALAALGYDAARILADAMKRAGLDRRPEAPRRDRGDQGLPGRHRQITIDEDRNAVKTGGGR